MRRVRGQHQGHAAERAADEPRHRSTRGGARPAAAGQAERAPQAHVHENARRGQAPRGAEQRHGARPRDLPPRIAQQRARGGMSGALVEPAQRFLRAEGVQRLRGFAPLRFPFLPRRHRLRHQEA